MLACKIEDICEPNIVVQSVLGKELATMALSEGMATSADRGGLSEGRYARVLAVQWYGEGEKSCQKFSWQTPQCPSATRWPTRSPDTCGRAARSR